MLLLSYQSLKQHLKLLKTFSSPFSCQQVLSIMRAPCPISQSKLKEGYQCLVGWNCSGLHTLPSQSISYAKRHCPTPTEPWRHTLIPGLPRCHLVINDLTEYISLLLPGGPGVLFQSISAEEKVRHMIREGTLGNGEKWPSLHSNRQRRTTPESLHLLPVCNLIGGDTSDWILKQICKLMYGFWGNEWRKYIFECSNAKDDAKHPHAMFNTTVYAVIISTEQ